MPRLERQTERAAALPIAAFLLFMPPLAGLFVDAPPLAGIPADYVYLFGVWLALILVARRLAKTLLASEQPSGGARAGPAGDDAAEDREA